MKYILLDNAFASWREAILLCDSILSGFATLKYQKQFVSSLHNSVELFLKQIMLNAADHSVASVRNTKNAVNVKLYQDYNNSTDLNRYFNALSSEDIAKFKTITFDELIKRNKAIIGLNSPKDSFASEMKLLQTLRNSETHFMISKTIFLCERNFMTLYNFMIDFYKVLESSDLLPFWGDAWGEHLGLVFKRDQLTSFSYLNAIKNNCLATEVVEILNGSYSYGQPDSSSYDIAHTFCAFHEEYENSFEKIWTILEMLINHDLMSFEQIVVDETTQLFEDPESMNIWSKTYDIMLIHDI